MRLRYLWMLVAGCAALCLAQPGFANTANAPNAYFMFGGNIFEQGQSQNIGPAANTVLDEGMYWFEGECEIDPDDPYSDDAEDCDLLRFGAGFHPKLCSDAASPQINHYLPPQEDGGQAVQDALKNIQNNSTSPYCSTEPEYRPVDEILIDHQNKVFGGTYGDDDSPWTRPNLNLLVIADIPQTTDRGSLVDYATDARAKGTLESTCRLLHGEDDSGTNSLPAMPTWVMMAREHTSDAATYGGLLAAAGGTGNCCYDPTYNPNNPNSEPCDPTHPPQQIDICDELGGLTETDIRRGVADGKFQCAPGTGVQTGSMDFGDDTKGTLPHLLCHFAGENGHSNCTGPEAEKNKRRPTDVLAKMSCIRQLPEDYDGEPIQLCDRYGDCRTLEVCEKNDRDCSGVQFVDPNKTLFTLVGDENGTALCGQLADGGHVVTGCQNQGDTCTVDEAEGRCSVGRVVCENGDEVCEPQYEAMPEICNGLDDDCDGDIDNLSTSWDNFPQRDPTDLDSYDSDNIDRTAIHCFEKDVCRCAGGATLDYGGPGYEDHIMSWQPGTCECGEGLGEPSGGYTPAPEVDQKPKAGCSSAAAGGAVGGLVWWVIFGVVLWRRREN